jgi:hypothetical protein
LEFGKAVDTYRVEGVADAGRCDEWQLLAAISQGLLAMVVAGLMIGNGGRRQSAISDTTERYVDMFGTR